MPKNNHETAPTKPLDVFVHVPKTAGTSLRTKIIDKYDPESTWVYAASSGLFFRADKQLFHPKDTDSLRVKLLKRRAFSPVTRALIRCNNLRADSVAETHSAADAVVGHFEHTMFDDMTPAREVRKFTVLRDPLDRMVSHYRYLQSYQKVGRHLLGWMQHHDSSLSFADFALNESTQNFQTKLTGTNIKEYEAVGLTDHLPEFLCLAGLADRVTKMPHHNKTQGCAVDPVVNDPGFGREFRDFHADDYAMVEAARAALAENFPLDEAA